MYYSLVVYSSVESLTWYSSPWVQKDEREDGRGRITDNWSPYQEVLPSETGLSYKNVSTKGSVFPVKEDGQRLNKKSQSVG